MNAEQTFSVGITGHRPNRLHIGEPEVTRRLYHVLLALRSGSRGRKRIAISALAEGADRLFALLALDLGYQLHALLPFSSADYETTFADATTTPVYRDLLQRASKVTELPGTLDQAKEAYAAVGQQTVAQSDILVTVWDGKGAEGKGGTPEIISHAVERHKPVIWIHAGHYRQPALIARPTAHGPRDIPFEKLAPRAKKLSKKAVSLLPARVL